MNEQSINIAEILETTSKEVWDSIFAPDNSWKNDPIKCSKINQKLLYFNQSHSDTPEHIDKVIKALTRGVSLTQAAIGWPNPAIGRTDNSNKTHIKRGIQWRLVIAYSGFEITTKALMNHFQRTTDLTAICTYIDTCDLPDYQAIISPSNSQKKTANFEKWLSKEENALADFLGVTNGDAKKINRWIVESKPVDSWEEAVKLAKALRNATAHGFLLPQKISDWKLKAGMSTLADNLGEIMVAGLKKLI